jgi:hypothetical protein
MYVLAYSSHPVLHIQDKAKNQRPYALIYNDAITGYVGLKMTSWGKPTGGLEAPSRAGWYSTL